ncbi:MAG: ATP-binding protein [Bacteroidetes bacterium]|nr:ATP-binding protein [Bacteroidota bacterium]
MDNKKNEPIIEIKNRLSIEDFNFQKKSFSEKNLFTEILDSTPDYLVVLNQQRQIVYSNQAFKNLLTKVNDDSFYGKRPGEVLNCQRAFINPEGCGTTEFCTTCGALKVILSSLKGEEDVQECRIIQKETNEALDLRVWAKPLNIDGQVYSVFTFVDISHEKRRLALERIFFHDVLNTANGLKSYVNLLNDSSFEEIKEMEPIASALVFRLLEEIKAQRDLMLAENQELAINLQFCNSKKIINDLINLYKNQSISEEKVIEVDNDFKSIEFISDEILISRVLSNMIKNALESITVEKKIKIGCNLLNNKIQFFVHNPGFIPMETQYQIFQRSFSTKGVGRGLGTYSMKLITERYLKGKIYFNSSEENGTTFFAEYPINFE